MLIDSHCHFDLLDKNNPDNEVTRVIERATTQGVNYFLNVCVSIVDFPTVLKTAEKFPNVVASVGLHPNEQNEAVDLPTLLQLANHPKVVAIGETGLDYFRSTGDLSWQRQRFQTHIAAAKQLKKPLIIHTREASSDTLHILQDENARDVGGVMHCFTENWDVAKKALDLGFYISFSGIVTFKSAIQIQDVAKKVPFDRMLIETDSPYLAPVPFRGKPNEPGLLRHTAEYLADLRGISFDTFAQQTTQNFFTLFHGALIHV